eukprot:992521-Pyramimonas_sp.AAC.2
MEDGEFLMRNDALPAERIRAVQTGGCPHAAIREDISVNIAPLEELTAQFKTDFLLIESGGGKCCIFILRNRIRRFVLEGYIIDVHQFVPSALSCCCKTECYAVLRLTEQSTFDADNLAANYSRELADFIIYVIDVAGGDKIPRKGGPGITQADLLVIPTARHGH